MFLQWLKYFVISALILLAFAIFASNVLADGLYFERFDDYALESVNGKSNSLGEWEVKATSTGLIENLAIGNNWLKVNGNGTVLKDGSWLKFDNYLDTTAADYIFNFEIYTETGVDPVIGLYCSSTSTDSTYLMDYITWEGSNQLYIAGNATSRYWTDQTYSVLYWQISSTTNQSRIKINDGSWSTYKTYAGCSGHRNIYAIQFGNQAADSGTDYYWLDDLGYDGYWEQPSLESNLGYDFVFEDFNNLSHALWQGCHINENCNVWFSFTDNLIGNDVYLVPDVQFQQNPNYAYGYTTIVDIPGNQNAIVIPGETSTSTKDYCFYMVSNNGGDDFLSCDLQINWYDDGYFCDIIDGWCTGEWSLDPCHDMTAPTSTSIFLSAVSADWWMYNIECASKNVVHWMMTPDIDVLQGLGQNIYDLGNQFPINIYTQILDSFDNNRTATTTVMTPLWIINPDGSTTTIGNLTDKTQFENGIAYDLYMRLYDILEYVMYGLVVMYFIFRFSNIKQQYDN